MHHSYRLVSTLKTWTIKVFQEQCNVAIHSKMFDSFSYGNELVIIKWKTGSRIWRKKINFFAKNYDSQNNKVSIFMNLSCVQESHFHTKSLKIWAHATLTRKTLIFTNHQQTVHYTENDTAKPHFTDTHLIQTPRYTRQFSLSLGKVSPYIFSQFNHQYRHFLWHPQCPYLWPVWL